MAETGAPYSSGDWIVSQGKEQDFISAWTDFAQWSVENFPALRSAFMIQQKDDPRHFISVGEWESAEAVPEWRGHPDFPQRLGAARSLCDEFEANDYTLVARVEE